MARYKTSDYTQSFLSLPINLLDQLVAGTLEHAIHHIIEEKLDLKLFDKRYKNDNAGRKAIDPRILLKIGVVGYSRGLLSSRSIERAGIENITFMALACTEQPDHSTIAAFISSFRFSKDACHTIPNFVNV